MTTMEAVAIYAGLNIVLLVALGFRVSAARNKASASLGDGGSEALALAIRAHANHAEYAAAFLVGLLIAAQASAPIIAIHALGAGFTICRVLHAIGMGTTRRNAGRFLGALGTYIILFVLGVGLVAHALV